MPASSTVKCLGGLPGPMTSSPRVVVLSAAGLTEVNGCNDRRRVPPKQRDISSTRAGEGAQGVGARSLTTNGQYVIGTSQLPLLSSAGLSLPAADRASAPCSSATTLRTDG